MYESPMKGGSVGLAGRAGFTVGRLVSILVLLLASSDLDLDVSLSRSCFCTLWCFRNKFPTSLSGCELGTGGRKVKWALLLGPLRGSSDEMLRETKSYRHIICNTYQARVKGQLHIIFNFQLMCLLWLKRAQPRVKYENQKFKYMSYEIKGFEGHLMIRAASFFLWKCHEHR